MSKLPAFQFYPGDWLKDPNLRRCTHAAKGVWMDLLCLMFESEERGVLATAGVAWSDDEIALAVGGDRAVVLACVQELTHKGVANRQSNGALYSRRLIRDEHKRRLCVAAGKRGGNPQLTGTLNRPPKGEPKGPTKGPPKREPTPSASSSTSPSGREEPPPSPTRGAPQAAPLHPTDALAAGADWKATLRADADFVAAWQRWKFHLADPQIAKAMSRSQEDAVLLDAARHGPPRAVEVIAFSIRKGAKNLIWDAPQSAATKPTPTRQPEPPDWLPWLQENYPDHETIPYADAPESVRAEYRRGKRAEGL